MKLPGSGGYRSPEASNRWQGQVSDISPLAVLTGLCRLDLGNTRVDDLSPLNNMTHLQRLFLDGTRVVDVSSLANLSNLEYLDLRGTNVADLTSLARLAHLKELDLGGTAVTAFGAAEPTQGPTSSESGWDEGCRLSSAGKARKAEGAEPDRQSSHGLVATGAISESATLSTHLELSPPICHHSQVYRDWIIWISAAPPWPTWHHWKTWRT